MRRIARLCAVVLLPALLIAGCWSRRELTEVSISGMLGLDWSDGQYMVTMNILAPTQQQGQASRRLEAWTISDQAPALDTAISKIDRVLSRAITLAHVRAIVFGEELARRGIGESLDFLLRSVELRPTAWVAVTNGTAHDLLKARPQQEGALINTPLGFQDTAQRRSSITPARRLVEVANVLQEEGIDLTLPLFHLATEEPPRPEGAVAPMDGPQREIVFGGAGAFRGDRLVGWLSPEEARGELWALDRAVRGAVAALCPDEERQSVFRLRKSAGDLWAYVTGSQVRALIRVEVYADLNEFGCREFPAPEEGAIDALEKVLHNEVEQELKDALRVSRELGSDFLGLGRALYRRSPPAFRSRSATWEETLATMPVELDIRVRVPRTGQLAAPFRWEKRP